MKIDRLATACLTATAVLVPACGGGGDSDGESAEAAALDLEVVSNGFGNLLPHTVLALDESGNPTGTVIPILDEEDLIANLSPTNGIRPTVQFPSTAILPTGVPGNQFIYARFNRALDVDSVLSSSPGAQSNSGLTGRITLVSLDPIDGTPTNVKARVFVNGRTYAGTPEGDPLALPLQEWIEVDDDGHLHVKQVDGAFPGTGFPGARFVDVDGEPVDQFPTVEFSGQTDLVSEDSIVFVADNDGDLSTIDTFPVGRQLKMRITTSVAGANGKTLKRAALASTTVGPDNIRPEIAKTPPPNNLPAISPGQGDTDVDPLTNIRVEFTEPVQPFSVGSVPTGIPPVVSTAIQVQFGPQASPVTVPFTLLPVSVFDLTTYDLTPAYNFPGAGPDAVECTSEFSTVRITVNPNQFNDLSANVNQFGGFTSFSTGQGPGIVNAPVTPDAIYVGRTGAIPGLTVIDLNGFGGGTGNPEFDPTYQTFGEGRSNFPNNPNLKAQGSLLQPALVPGTCTINGGSAGVFTLTRDSSLQELIVRAPTISSVGDMMVGRALDSTFNNAPFPFGCQSNGGSLCTSDGFKVVNPVVNGLFGGNQGNTMQPIQLGGGQANGIIGYGAENLVCWAPHPNPPPLVFPPLCVSPYLAGQEPTSVNSGTPGAAGGNNLQNLLVPGDPFGNPNLGVPPTGLLTPEQNNHFIGPSPGGATSTAQCLPYMVRQQVGHFLYVIDRGRREVVVLNSNRMTVVDRIETVDPTSLAMSPNLNLLAVTNQLGGTVSFIDIDPASSTFHQIVHETVVGLRPRGIAWEPGNEDILVTNEGENTMSIIGAASLAVRKVVSSQLNQPFDVAITPRQECQGFGRGVYFGYVLNRTGRVAIFESGPNTVNGWGYDDMVGIASSTFRNPKSIQPDHVDLSSAVWIAHEGPINPLTDQPGPFGVGAVSKLVVVSGFFGYISLNAQSLLNPQLRDMFLDVQVSIGNDVLSGLPVDFAFDDLRSVSGLPNTVSQFSAGAPTPVNGKNLVRGACPGVFNNNEPRYMFVAVPNPTNGTGVVDVIRVDGNFVRIDTNAFQPGIQSIPATGVQIVMDYFRQ